MKLTNTETNYGAIARLLHWVLGTVIIGLFALGIWMVELTYYSEWYKTAPSIHKSLGILLASAMVFRLLWRWFNARPADEPNMAQWERLAAHLAHYAIYGLVFLIIVAGYMISTADGRAIDVFSWFSVPAIYTGIENQEDIAGVVHEWAAYLLMALVAVHALVSLKHHFISKDNTLRKMLGLPLKG